MNDDANRAALHGYVAKLTALLLARGRGEAVVRTVLGGNFLRVAGEVWG